MAQKTTGYRPTPASPTADAHPSTERPASDDTDVLLDEIDAVLIEEEEFAVNFRQKGGQ